MTGPSGDGRIGCIAALFVWRKTDAGEILPGTGKCLGLPSADDHPDARSRRYGPHSGTIQRGRGSGNDRRGDLPSREPDLAGRAPRHDRRGRGELPGFDLDLPYRSIAVSRPGGHGHRTVGDPVDGGRVEFQQFEFVVFGKLLVVVESFVLFEPEQPEFQQFEQQFTKLGFELQQFEQQFFEQQFGEQLVLVGSVRENG